MKRHGFSYLQTRKKEHMTPSCLKLWVKFANYIKETKIIRTYGKKTCFCLDGKSLSINYTQETKPEYLKQGFGGKKMKDWHQTVWQKTIKLELVGGRHISWCQLVTRKVLLCAKNMKNVNSPYFSDFIIARKITREGSWNFWDVFVQQWLNTHQRGLKRI